jgi:DNA-binding MarR family transcriptional regulator
MPGRLPLSSLLSHALVAFTIEFDNEVERQLPHCTTNENPTDAAPLGPWLVSMVMWFNCMRFLDENGLTESQLQTLARTPTNLHGMRRWGYVSVKPDPTDTRPKPPRSSWLIRPTRAGRSAQNVWRPLFDVIEDRWRERFGANAIQKLRASLVAIVEHQKTDLPDCLPILGYGLVTKDMVVSPRKPSKPSPDAIINLPLVSLLAKVLLAFAIEFEQASAVSLSICANVLRPIGEKEIRVRDLPRLSGVSKEGIAMALSFLVKRGYAIVETDLQSRAKVVLLTPKGRKALKKYASLLSEIDERWQAQFGKAEVEKLRASLETLIADATPDNSPLFRGLKPHPTNWRAKLPQSETLPHFPMVLHRGGYPDGS